MKSFVPRETAAPASERAGNALQPEHADTPGTGRSHRNAEVNFHGQKRSNATHISTADPQAGLYRKGRGREAKLSYLGHALMENRTGLIVEAGATAAPGYAEREAAIAPAGGG